MGIENKQANQTPEPTPIPGQNADVSVSSDLSALERVEVAVHGAEQHLTNTLFDHQRAHKADRKKSTDDTRSNIENALVNLDAANRSLMVVRGVYWAMQQGRP